MLIFRDIHVVSWRRILVACVFWPTVVLICFNLLLPRIGELESATYGLVQGTLVYSILLFIVVVFIGMGLWGGELRASDIGLAASKLPTGLLVTFGGWAALHLIVLIITLSRDPALSIGTAWKTGRWTWEIGLFTNQILGNALVEELMFRGFLIPQLYLKFSGTRDQTRWIPLVGAIVVSQLYFALIHIPNLHNLSIPVGGGSVGMLAAIFVTGVVQAVLYLRTGNLFVGVGFHALVNAPTLLMQSAIPPEPIVFGLMLVVLVAWPWFSKQKRSSARN